MSSPAPVPGAIVDLRGRTTRAIRARVALASALIASVLLVPAIALGHAELATVSPADKSSVSTPPTEIVMTFTESLDPAKSSIRLVDTSGKVVAEGGTVSSSNPNIMRLALTTPLRMGTYTARWTSASALDGDLDHGTTLFTTGAIGPQPGSPSPSSAAASASELPSVAASVAPSAIITAAPSSPPTTPAASTGDAVIPVIVALIVLAGLGLWLLRGRGRAR